MRRTIIYCFICVAALLFILDVVDRQQSPQEILTSKTLPSWHALLNREEFLKDELAEAKSDVVTAAGVRRIDHLKVCSPGRPLALIHEICLLCVCACVRVCLRLKIGGLQDELELTEDSVAEEPSNILSRVASLTRQVAALIYA